MWIPTLEQATRLGWSVFPTQRTPTPLQADDASSLARIGLLVAVGVPLVFLRDAPLVVYLVLSAIAAGLALSWGSLRRAHVARRTLRDAERAGTTTGTARFAGEVIAVIDPAEDAPAIMLADVVGARKTTNERIATVRAFVLRADDGRLAWIEATDHALVRLGAPRREDVRVGSRVEVRGVVRREPLPLLVRLEGYRDVPIGDVFSGSFDRPLFVLVD